MARFIPGSSLLPTCGGHLALSCESGLACTVKTSACLFMFRGVCGSGEGEEKKGRRDLGTRNEGGSMRVRLQKNCWVIVSKLKHGMHNHNRRREARVRGRNRETTYTYQGSIWRASQFYVSRRIHSMKTQCKAKEDVEAVTNYLRSLSLGTSQCGGESPARGVLGRPRQEHSAASAHRRRGGASGQQCGNATRRYCWTFTRPPSDALRCPPEERIALSGRGDPCSGEFH